MPVTPATTPLPSSWSRATPTAADVHALYDLQCRHETAARGGSSGSQAAVGADVAGTGSGARSHLLLRDGDGATRAWATVHDRAAGRSLAAVVVDPELASPVADAAARALLDWVEQASREVGAERGLATTQVDTGAFAQDERQQRWLSAAGL